MATATLVNVWRERGRVFAAARVVEGGAQGNVEYLASVPDDAAFAAMSAAEKKEALRVAVKAARDAQQAGAANVSGISGAVTI